MKEENYNANHIKSSDNVVKLNNFDFESPKIDLDLNILTKEEIYEKMYEIIKSREKQIRDLSIMVGNFNETLHIVKDKNEKFIEENKLLNEKILKKDSMLNQELSNKEIMFIRLSNIEQEYEKLLSQVQNSKSNTTEKKGFFRSFFGYNNQEEIPKINSKSNSMIITKNEPISSNKMENVSNTIAEKQNTSSNSVKTLKFENSDSSQNKIDINIKISQDNNLEAPKIPLNSNKESKIASKTSLDKKKLPPSKRLASDQIDYKPVFG